LRLTVPSDPAKQTTDDQEFLMDTQDIVETWRREAVQEGIEQGREQSLKQGVAHSLVEVYEARFGAMPEDLRAVVEDTADEPTLVAWLRLVGTAAPTRSLRAFARSAPASSQPRRLVLVNHLDLVYLCIGKLDRPPVGSVRQALRDPGRLARGRG
jgi:hypothetical protein